MSSTEADCLFCKIVLGDIPSTPVYETGLTYAFRDINAQAEIHVLVVPRQHYEDAAVLASEDPALLAEVMLAGVEVAKQEGIDESGYRMVFNTGPDAGRTVFHAHLHVLGGEQLGLFGRPYRTG
ncbi:MAG TPA: histidine triad nucleotide-binding protein [Actinophytocola sp.]|uniref:histidine triad nucleotide-binding protein n=1 Tax=Actinophytocola sp. TaxID=1872138 RepID=UPI002DDCFE01|nr:histidine triad nucleotide-binding protein [Actinophytocola sp.]HEV2780183.1 histidine triad nucleotide-binding protein [Actinophytocola sp.]